MNADYLNDVHRFGSSGRLKDENGEAFNISHGDDCQPAKVRTDGRGNVVSSPLVWRKPCFARPERYVRGHTGGRLWRDESGQRHLSQTPCDRCSELSPGVYEACGRVVDERIAFNTAIEASFDAWMTACGNDFGPICFTGHRGKLWHAFLQAVVDHGGWTNVNDDQVKLEALRLQKAERDKRNAAARAGRERRRIARCGTPRNITTAYLQSLHAERDRRAEGIKGLRCLSGRTSRDMLWLQNLPDTSCDRISDVWHSRELLSRGGHQVTGRAIAEHMMRHGAGYGLSLPSLTARVHDDLRRVAKLEDNSTGAPIWRPWIDSSCS